MGGRTSWEGNAMMQNTFLSNKKKRSQSNMSHNVKRGQNQMGSPCRLRSCQICSALNVLLNAVLCLFRHKPSLLNELNAGCNFYTVQCGVDRIVKNEKNYRLKREYCK